MLRGEALPLPTRELHALRDRMSRDYAEEVVPTASGPFLAIRVPHLEPDFLRDLDIAVDVLPYRDLKGFRGVVLLGDRNHMGVSADMLRALMEGKVQAEKDWMARLRVELGPWAFRVTKMPGDPQRRLRAVFRVEAESVSALDEPDFDRMADALPSIKAASPGQTRPAFVHLVAHADHVTIDGAKFFTDLERRRRRQTEAQERAARRELQEKHEIALAHLERITRERERRRVDVPRPVPPRAETPAAAPLRMPEPPVPVPRSTPPVAPPSPPTTAPRYPVDRMPRDVPREIPAPRPREVDERFAAAARHPEEVAVLRHALESAGYRTKERLVVRDIPVTLAAARPDGYPARVLVTFHATLEPDVAQALLVASRRVGADLVLLVADEVAPGVDRVTVATHLKVIRPDAVRDVRFG